METDALKKTVETSLNDWLRAATINFEKENTRLTVQLAEQTAARDELCEKYEQLKQENARIHAEWEDSKQSTAEYKTSTERLLASFQGTKGIIETAFRKIQQSEKDRFEAEARERTFQAYNDALQEREEALVVENAALKARIEAINNTGQSRTLKDHNLPKESEHCVFSPADQRTTQAVESLGRLQRRYDRIVGQKEKAEKFYYSSYVEWSRFREWWREFSATPGVDQIISAFNRSVQGKRLKGTLPEKTVTSTNSLVKGAPGRNNDGNSPQRDRLAEGGDPEEAATATPIRKNGLSSKELADAACEELANACQELATQCEAVGSVAPPVADGLVNPMLEASDPEKTQETTPGSSPSRPFRFDLTSIRLPLASIYRSPINKIKTPVRRVTPDSPIIIKQEVSPIKVPKAVPEDDGVKALPVVAPVAGPGPSTLGKRKAPVEDAPLPQATTGRKSYVPLVLQYMDGTKVVSPKPSKKRHAETLDRDLATPKKHGKTIKDHPSKGKAVTRYEVNPDRNNGVNFAYDEVVRNKAARKRMEATDCDQCREFYKAVGPLPPRLQAPLWKSPTSSQVATTAQQRRGCNHHHDKETSEDSGEESEDPGVKAHRQEVSRHRHIMPAGETPPGYWNLNFPDTQEVNEIRNKAEKMHRRRERFMDKEAEKKDGKYRRK